MAEGALRTFEDLECWQACRRLRQFVARTCRALPEAEEFRLKDQLLRASRRTTACIAEGYGRFHYLETAQFCRQARGSAYEVLDHFITAVDEEVLPQQSLSEVRELARESIALINGYIRYLLRRKSDE